MNRSRKTGKGLPRRVYLRGQTYYFFAAEAIRDTDGKLKKWVPLSKVKDGEAAMLQALAKLLQDKRSFEGTMPHLCAQFKADKLKKYGDETRADYGRYLDKIAEDFEEFRVEQVTTRDWADFLRNNYKGKANTAQKVTRLAGKLFRYGISEGYRHDNPIDQIDLDDYETERRTVLPTHEQIQLIREHGMYSKERKDTGQKVKTASGPMFACIIDMTYLCWQRAIDVRTLKESQIVDGRIRFKPSKTEKSSGKMVDIIITPEIQAVIDRAREIKKTYRKNGQPLISPYLFCTTKGGAYGKSGLYSMWDRAKERAGITDDIQFRDIRALGATDAAKSGIDRKQIQDRLVHTSGKTTDIYIKESVAERSEISSKLPWA